MIDNNKIGICRHCAKKNERCSDRERANAENILMTYICNGFIGPNWKKGA